MFWSSGWFSPQLTRGRADIGVIVLEPIEALGFWTRVGHAATYLSNIRQDGSPIRMRVCRPGERGGVVSKYTPISANEDYDWAIVPFEQLWSAKMMRAAFLDVTRLLAPSDTRGAGPPGSASRPHCDGVAADGRTVALVVDPEGSGTSGPRLACGRPRL